MADLPPSDLLPDADEAQGLLEEELAKPVYQEAQPTLLERLITSVLDWLEASFSSLRGLDAGTGTIVLAVGAAVLILIAGVLVRPRLNARRASTGSGVFHGSPARTAAAHRARAEAAAAAGNWDEALTERLRAIIRSAEERVVLDSRPGRTASEAALQLGNAFPRSSPEIEWLANRFNEVHYGHLRASAEDQQRAAGLDSLLEDLRPSPAPAPAVPAAPR
ncbi:DUF4129 domain-containing protein [Arthrobacter sp. H41]|uniref:DUF4129 domain-containing protein n=1 Tax=Arthrobacter sp. H41 TaxID=1312978 RepID=UPI00047EFC60|nr:DUF4129 domain-containing protein [Arthrobacter sp. H41]